MTLRSESLNKSRLSAENQAGNFRNRLRRRIAAAAFRRKNYTMGNNGDCHSVDLDNKTDIKLISNQ